MTKRLARLFGGHVHRRRTRRPEWDGDGPRVLVEYPDFATPSALAARLNDMGYVTEVCTGPGDCAGCCELLNRGSCSLVEEADVVVNGFGLGTGEYRAILRALRARYPDTPVVVEATEPRAREHPELLVDCIVTHTPLTSRSLLDAVGEAVSLSDRGRQAWP